MKGRARPPSPLVLLSLGEYMYMNRFHDCRGISAASESRSTTVSSPVDVSSRVTLMALLDEVAQLWYMVAILAGE